MVQLPALTALATGSRMVPAHVFLTGTSPANLDTVIGTLAG